MKPVTFFAMSVILVILSKLLMHIRHKDKYVAALYDQEHVSVLPRDYIISSDTELICGYRFTLHTILSKLFLLLL